MESAWLFPKAVISTLLGEIRMTRIGAPRQPQVSNSTPPAAPENAGGGGRENRAAAAANVEPRPPDSPTATTDAALASLAAEEGEDDTDPAPAPAPSSDVSSPPAPEPQTRPQAEPDLDPVTGDASAGQPAASTLPPAAPDTVTPNPDGSSTGDTTSRQVEDPQPESDFRFIVDRDLRADQQRLETQLAQAQNPQTQQRLQEKVALAEATLAMNPDERLKYDLMLSEGKKPVQRSALINWKRRQQDLINRGSAVEKYAAAVALNNWNRYMEHAARAANVQDSVSSEGLTANSMKALGEAHKFGLPLISGVAERGNVSDHPHGNAIDVSNGVNTAEERQYAEWVRANPEAVGAKYVIFAKQIASPSSDWEWRPYTHPSGASDQTLDHFDHVHVSVN